jgi:3-phenylpropionate/trans-cinnamate dioxygenase ferredoxin subunit
MSSHVICRVSELPPGERKIVEIEGRSIGIFNLGGTFYALRNVCPHQQAPLCLGKITGTTQPAPPGDYQWICSGQIIRCPWHAWEFDITTGQSVFNPHRLRVKSYKVTVESAAPEGQAADAEADPSVETYPVSAVNGEIVLHL